MTTFEHDCLVLGGGVVGLSLAYELAQHQRQVTVVDRRQVGRAASWAGAGILPPPLREQIVDPLDQLRKLSHQMHVQWAEQLRSETGIDNGLRRSGGLYLATSAGEAAALAGLESYFAEHGVETNRLEMSELQKLEPALGPAVEANIIRSAMHCADEFQLRNPRHLQALAAACRQRGVQFKEQVSEVKLNATDAGLEAIIDDDRHRAEALCITAGAWSLDLLASIGIPNGVFPVRGQMVLFRFAQGQPPFTHILNEGPRYLVPRDDGRVLAGSSEEEVGFDESTSQEVIHSLREFACRLAPILEEAEVEQSWAGLRPASFDGFPYIGRAPDHSNLFIATGHFRSGLHLSTGTAKVTRQLICGQPPDVELTQFSPSRG